MELIELQETWFKLNKKVERQKVVMDKMLIDVVKMKHNSKIRAILKYEGAGAFILFLGVIVIIWNIKSFDTWPLQVCAVISIFFMTLSPIFSLISLYRMNNMDMAKRNYKQTIIEFTKRRTQFLLIQKWGIVLAVIFTFTIIPLMLKIASGKDFFAGDSNNLLWFIPFALIALFFFARWGYSYYERISADAQDILQELEDFN